MNEASRSEARQNDGSADPKVNTIIETDNYPI